ncbi:MAG: adenine-specific methyltransferase EcoRI family protein [Candidatus Omnitrophica bacterium]|nr:adenine-specific methyltransferase EcoRI family protein [Candidatus Omnitrophota bacterium]
MGTKSSNKKLRKANQAKKDEFYTQLVDIENELKHYKDQFRGKVIFCNCDDPYISNFFHYFAYNFETLRLKKLITTCYKNKQYDLFSENKDEEAVYLEYTGDKNGDRVPNPDEIGVKLLKGDGDFRSAECLKLIKEADIIVTNPPFSLFREYVAQLIEHDKKFLIIGNKNAITYKEIFKLIKENKLWAGYRSFAGGMWFYTNDDSQDYDRIVDGRKLKNVPSIWFTNIDTTKRHEDLVLYKKYSPEAYRKYYNYDAIDVSKVSEIPMNYGGAIGVPITFLDKYNPKQFEIIGLGISNSGKEVGVKPYKKEHKKYRKEIQKRGAVDGDLYMITNGIVDVPYARVLIKNKKVKK